MAAGNDSGEETGNNIENNTGAHPITSPFDWGVGNASAPEVEVPPNPDAPVPDAPVPAAPVPAAPVPAAPVPAAPVPAAPVPAAPPTELIPAELAPAPAISPPMRRPESYFTSDSEDEGDPASRIVPPIDSPIDSLFGETQFKDYEGEPMVGPPPTRLNPFAGAYAGAADSAAPLASADPSIAAGRATPVAAMPREPSAPFSKNQKLLFWVAGGVIALLVLAILFAIGTKIAAAPAPVAASKSVTPKVSPSPSPSSIPSVAGPVAAGVHLWSDLRGGECVDPYSNPFDLRFTVVDCGAPHPAQMVFRGTFAGASTAAYPGLESLQSQINPLCTAPGVIDLATAGAYSDIQFQASYAATTEEWTKGQRDYFCFVNRVGGEPITGSVAGTPAK
jgi:hypothetical protein